MSRRNLFSHLCGLFCAIIWGSTFLVSKILLVSYSPVQIMLLRFLLAYVALWLIYPKWQIRIKDELGFLLMSLFGNMLYYMAENSALLYTYSSNVSILVSLAPIFTLIFIRIFHPGRKVPVNRLAGIFLAFAGTILVVFNGALVLHLSMKGDVLSLGAAICWAVYSLILARYTDKYSSFLISRKLMFYGIILSLPVLLIQGRPFPIFELQRPEYLAGVLFLGLVGSALCYIAWNYACAGIGIVAANMYIYAIPFVTLAAGAVFMDEPISAMAVIGAALIVTGMMLASDLPQLIKRQ